MEHQLNFNKDITDPKILQVICDKVYNDCISPGLKEDTYRIEDYFTDDTYICGVTKSGKVIFYVIWQWWNYINNADAFFWVDFYENGTVYIACAKPKQVLNRKNVKN